MGLSVDTLLQQKALTNKKKTARIIRGRANYWPVTSSILPGPQVAKGRVPLRVVLEGTIIGSPFFKGALSWLL